MYGTDIKNLKLFSLRCRYLFRLSPCVFVNFGLIYLSRRFSFYFWTSILLLPLTHANNLDFDLPTDLVMAGSAKKCCIPLCENRGEYITLHQFPHPEKEKERFAIWVNHVGGSLSSLDPLHVFKNRKICHDHFEEKYLTWTRRLSNVAVPTLRIPGFEPDDVVMRDITNTDDIAGTTDSAVMASTSTVPVYAATEEKEVTAPLKLDPLKPAVRASTSAGFKHDDVVMRDITNTYDIAGTSDSAVMASTSVPVPVYAATEEEEVTAPLKSKPHKPVMRASTAAGPFCNDQKTLRQLLKKAIKKNDSYATRLKKAMKLSENATFQKTLNKFTTMAALFISMQFREAPKKKMARRFTDDEKVMALTFYKNGPRSYRFFSKIFILPSPLTISRLIARANLRAGINKKLFHVMSKKIQKMTRDDKLCVLLFDEISLSPHFDYNQKKDKISGFVTNGIKTEKKVCDHALVFMIRGVLRNYKQPIAYTFCAGSTKKEELAILIKNIIKELHGIGLRVLATVCDQGASNVSAINYLIAETKSKYLRKGEELKRNIFEIDDNEVIPLYDPPHLIKGIRNNLLEKNLKCTINGEVKLAKWEHLISLYQEDPQYSGIRLVNKLSYDHVNPEKCKMKVKYATQVFSEKVAGTMGYLSEKNILPQECRQTADVLLFFDKLFDSLNGSQQNSKKRCGKPLLCEVKPNSIHNVFWAEGKQVLNSTKYVKNGKEFKVPSILNFLFTINNVEYLRDILFNVYNIKSFWMRHYNQDPLENFFGCVRSHGCRNISPSPEGFEVAFASLLLNNLTGSHSPGANCESDDCITMFNSMRDLFILEKINDTTQDLDLSYMEENIIVDFEVKKCDPRTLAQLEYVTGYLIKQLKKRVFRNCVSCNDYFSNKNKNCEYLRVREFRRDKQHLFYPSTEIIKMFSEIQDILTWVLKKQSDMNNLKNVAKTILAIEIDTSVIRCNIHRQQNIDVLFELSCRFFIFNWCKDVNNILKGRVRDTVDGDFIKMSVVDYVKKRRIIKK